MVHPRAGIGCGRPLIEDEEGSAFSLFNAPSKDALLPPEVKSSRLARRLGKDPDRWKDLSEVLPLLAQRSYYTTLKHGYARGSEPVQYVTRVRNYEDILKRTAE